MSIGDPPKGRVTLWRVIVADTLVAFVLSAVMFVGAGPGYVAQLRDADWQWELTAFATGFVMVALLGWLLSLSTNRIKPLMQWTKETYAGAKARRDLAPDKMSIVEQILMAIFLGPAIFAAIVPVTPLVQWAYMTFDWMDSIEGAIVILLPMLFIGPFLAAMYRLSAYAAVNLAIRITGSPLR